MFDLGMFVLRATVGSLMAGHGAQKLFGKFGGYGIEGTSRFMESLGLKPGRQWAILSGVTEFGGGALTAFGFLNPIGPIAIIGASAVESIKAHWNRPIWNSGGGAELPLVNGVSFAAVALLGPGKLSVDGLFGIRIPSWMTVLALVGTAAGIANAAQSGFAAPPVPPQEQAEQPS
ncbi:MAG: DoxX family protein [Chloroflexota bacterium]